jgi:L-ascorbate metabolism protein UlaG (beta-lactamase superfamily)
MKIKWYGHSSFGITTAAGVRIITDPFVPGSYDGALAYIGGWEAADVILQSHEHPDHTGGRVPGNPVVIKGAGTYKAKGLEFKGLAVKHDESGGRERGDNTLFVFAADGLKVVFAGDLGHVLTPEQVKAVGAVDVLFLPVGGYFTIDAAAATKVVEQLQAQVIIPMHYKTPACGFPIADAEAFLKGKAGVDRLAGAEVELTAGALAGPRIIVLDYVK